MILTASPEAEQLLLSEPARTGISVGEVLQRGVAAHFATTPNPPSDVEREHLDSHHIRRMEAAAELARRLGLTLRSCMERYDIRPLGFVE